MAKQKFELSSTYIIELSFDGGGATLAAGSRTTRTIPFDCEVTGWTIVCADPWNIDVDVLISVKALAYKDFPDKYGMPITPKVLSISGASKNQGLSKWIGTLKKFSQLIFTVEAASGARHVVIALHVKSK